MNKKGALELSIGTIVVIVIAITMLILGIVFVRSIMCSGIQISEDLSIGVRNEIKTLFGANKEGVACLGEGSQEVRLGTGGRRKIVCMIRTDEQTKYRLTSSVDTIKGASRNIVDKWIIDKDWSGEVSPGGEGAEAVTVLLDIPKDAPATTLKIITKATNENTGSITQHTSYIDIIPVGFVKTTIC